MSLLSPTRRAALHETALYLASHPGLWVVAEISRRLGPVLAVPKLGSIVNDPLVARAILLDEAHFSKGGPGGFGALITQVMGPYAILNMDGDEHRDLRRRLRDLFTPSSAMHLTDTVWSRQLRDLMARLQRGETVDIARVVRDATGQMMCHILGVVPPAGAEIATYRRVVALSERLIAYATLDPRPLSPDQVAAIRDPYERLVAHARSAFDSDDPGRTDALIPRLKAAGLRFEEVQGVLAALFMTGTQTISTAVPRLVALLVDSGEWARLRDDPARLDCVIDEGLRCIIPSPVMVRAVLDDTEIDGHRFRKGVRAVIFTYNVLKSRQFYPHPARFDPDRAHDPRVRHLWYGAGHHYCLGFALAQQEIRAVLQALLQVGGVPHIVRRGAARRVMLPAYARLDLRFDQRGAA
jgi:cytochrome P450